MAVGYMCLTWEFMGIVKENQSKVNIKEFLNSIQLFKYDKEL